MTEHLGYEPHERVGADNSRNGTRAKTVLTEIGPVEIDVPGTGTAFRAGIVRKRQRRLNGVDDLVISLVAKGLTTGEVPAHLAEVYGAEVSRETDLEDHRRGDGGADRVAEPAAGPGLPGGVHRRDRGQDPDGQVANRPIYVAIGVTVDGERDILGLWAGSGGEGAKYWQQVLTELRNRGVEDVLHPRLRRADRPARRGRPRLAGDHRADLCDPPAAQQLPLRLQEGLAGSSPETSSPSTPRRPRPRRWPGSPSSPTPGRPATRRSCGCGRTPGRSSPRSCVRRRDPHGHLHDQRDREPQLPVPPVGQGPRALPQRAGRAEAPLPRSAASTRPDAVGSAGRSAGKPPSTPSPSPSTDASSPTSRREIHRLLDRPSRTPGWPGRTAPRSDKEA